MAKRRVSIFTRNGVFYYVSADGKRVSLRTKDRATALRRRAEATAKGAAVAPTTPVERAGTPPPPPPSPPPPPATPSSVAPTHDPQPPPGVGSPAPGGGERPDPLQRFGASASAPPPSPAHQPDGYAHPNDAPPADPTDAEVRELAEILTAVAQLVTASMAMNRGIDPGAVSERTQEFQIARAMPIARRIAEMPVVRSIWTELALFAVACGRAAHEQFTTGKPIDESQRPAGA